MGVPVENEYHGESHIDLGSYRFGKWETPLSPNLKAVPFFIQAFGFLLAFIGAICIGAMANVTAEKSLAAWTANATEWSFASANPLIADVHQHHNAAIACGVVAVFFMIVGWLEPVQSSVTSYGFGIGLFFSVASYFVIMATNYAEKVTSV